MILLGDHNRKKRLKIWWFLVLTGLAVIVYSLYQQKTSITYVKEEAFIDTSQDRILILAPHPDDDILACGGIIQKARKKNIPVKIVYLTNGDMNEWSFLVYRKRPVIMPKAVQSMGLVRHDEAVRGAQMIGVSSENLIFLGYPDFGTMNIWYRHWGKSLPYRSMLTKVAAVPYPNAYRPGASYKGEDIVKDIESILRAFKPTKIFVSHPGDHNVDHRALYLFTKVALWNTQGDFKADLYPYIIHVKSWPRPSGFHPELQLAPPKILRNQLPWSSISLTPEEIDLKRKALTQHHSQYMSSGRYLVSFIRSNELFGDFKPVDLKFNVHDAVIPSESKEEEIFQDDRLLTDNQKVAFVGIQERTVRVVNDRLEMTVNLSRPIGKAVGVTFYLFGYRGNMPFEQMPKIIIKTGTILYDVFDQGQKLPEDTIRIDRRARSIVLTVPLKLLGNPEKILTSAQTYLGKIPLDWLSWHVIDLLPENQ
jgi:LmbE family N-acetylglucosaminyl deacetylase